MPTPRQFTILCGTSPPSAVRPGIWEEFKQIHTQLVTPHSFFLPSWFFHHCCSFPSLLQLFHPSPCSSSLWPFPSPPLPTCAQLLPSPPSLPLPWLPPPHPSSFSFPLRPVPTHVYPPHSHRWPPSADCQPADRAGGRSGLGLGSRWDWGDWGDWGDVREGDRYGPPAASPSS